MKAGNATSGAAVGDSMNGPLGVAATQAEQSASVAMRNPEMAHGIMPDNASSNGQERPGSTPHFDEALATLRAFDYKSTQVLFRHILTLERTLAKYEPMHLNEPQPPLCGHWTTI